MTAKGKGTSVDLTGEDIRWESPEDYAAFLGLDALLSVQEPRWLGKHDEVMFIIVHQVSELWIKLMMHELTHLRDLIHADDMEETGQTFARITRIQEQLLRSWDVTATLEPVRYLEFRETESFRGGSGFQSYQYRMLEFILGNKNEKMIEVHRSKPKIYQQMVDILGKPSLYDEALALLKRRGFAIPVEALERDWRRPYFPSDAVEVAWLEIYDNYRKHIDLYRFAERLVDIEYRFQQWRFTHVKTVERLIGFRKGTGGSQGVNYLMKALDITFFPELWSARTKFGVASPPEDAVQT